VAKVGKSASLPQWFAVSTRKEARQAYFFGKKCWFSHGKVLLPKSDKRQTIVAMHLCKAELFKLNSRQTIVAIASYLLGKAQDLSLWYNLVVTRKEILLHK